MIGNKIHKCLLSLTLLISVVSFSAVVHEQVNPVHTITVVVPHKNAPPSAYHVSLAKQNLTRESTTYYSFNFKQLIQTQNNLFTQKDKTQSIVCLTLKDVFNTAHPKLVSATKTEDSLSFIV